MPHAISMARDVRCITLDISRAICTYDCAHVLQLGSAVLVINIRPVNLTCMDHRACVLLGRCNDTRALNSKLEMPLSLATNVSEGWLAYSQPICRVWCDFIHHAHGRLPLMNACACPNFHTQAMQPWVIIFTAQGELESPRVTGLLSSSQVSGFVRRHGNHEHWTNTREHRVFTLPL